MDNQLIHVLLLGVAFMILFTAIQATSMVEVHRRTSNSFLSLLVLLLHAIEQSMLEGLENGTVDETSFHGIGCVAQGDRFM